MSNTTITPGVGAVALAGVAPTPATTINPTAAADSPFSITYTWSGLPNGAAGGLAPPGTPPMAYSTAFFEAVGTWGAAGSVQIEGSNDGTNWYKLSPAALTAAGVFASLGAQEYPRFLRPHVTAGDATTAITVSGRFRGG